MRVRRKRKTGRGGEKERKEERDEEKSMNVLQEID